jgi:thioredoxin reductase (NADPH)
MDGGAGMTIPVAIIGAGPAGIAAAVQLQRAGIRFLLYERGPIGGLLNEARRVENFPGIDGGLAGRDLAARLKHQLRAAKIAVERADVLRLAFRDDAFDVRSEQGTCRAARVLLACGTAPLVAGPPLDPQRLRGRLFASILPLLRVSGEAIAIIGGGDVACDYAMNLAARNRVHILVRSSRPRALPLLLERCRRHRRIVIHEQCRLTEVLIEKKGSVVLKVAQAAGGGGEIVCRRILTAVGRAPALDFLDPEVRAFLPGLVKEKRIFLAGDVDSGRFRQAAIAAGDGLRAAMMIQQESRCG